MQQRDTELSVKKKEKELSNTLHKDLTCITFVYITCKY